MRELLSRKINKNLKKYEGSLYGTTTTLYIYIYLSIYLSINIESVCCLLVLNSVTSTPQWIYIERESEHPGIPRNLASCLIKKSSEYDSSSCISSISRNVRDIPSCRYCF
jgi:hypothetical protein